MKGQMYEDKSNKPKNLTFDKQGRPKYPLSKPKDNADGLLEAQLLAKR